MDVYQSTNFTEALIAFRTIESKSGRLTGEVQFEFAVGDGGSEPRRPCPPESPFTPLVSNPRIRMPHASKDHSFERVSGGHENSRTAKLIQTKKINPFTSRRNQ